MAVTILIVDDNTQFRTLLREVVAEESRGAFLPVARGQLPGELENALSDDEHEKRRDREREHHHHSRQERRGQPRMLAAQAPEQPFVDRMDADRDHQAEQHRHPDRLQGPPESVGGEHEQDQEGPSLETSTFG